MGFLTPEIIQTALEVGLIYALIALSLFISFSILNICDLSTDGCYTLGCAVGAICTIAGHPVLGIFAAMLAGACSGFVTAFLQTVLGVPSILAGIIVNTGLYTINLMVMGFSSNLSIFGTDTVFSLMGSLFSSPFWITWNRLLLLLLIVAVICVLLHLFLRDRRFSADGTRIFDQSRVYNYGRSLRIELADRACGIPDRPVQQDE